MKEVCIAQGSAVTFSDVLAGGQAYNHSCKMSSQFCIPEVIKMWFIFD